MLNKANPTESLALEHIGMAELESPWLKSLTPTRNSHTWIAFGDGSWPMLALDQHPGTGWEIPHRRAQKGMPREDSAKNSVDSIVSQDVEVPEKNCSQLDTKLLDSGDIVDKSGRQVQETNPGVHDRLPGTCGRDRRCPSPESSHIQLQRRGVDLPKEGKHEFSRSSALSLPPAPTSYVAVTVRGLSVPRLGPAGLFFIPLTVAKCYVKQRSTLHLTRESHADRQSVPQTELLLEVMVIGELGVGKTSIIKRYVHQLFSQHYRATIGVDFALKVINWDSRPLVRLQLWDIAGQERFGNMTRVYYKEAVGAFVVFDVTRGSTFEAVSKWKHDLDSKVLLPNGSPIPAVLLANKCDQKKDGSQNLSQMDQFCREGGFVGWFETSAKDNINIDEAARFLVENILANYKTFPNEENDVAKPKLDLDPLKAESKSQCC
nr:PREDICTED: ras-related protein Rab-32 [Opisthocomus hoazin]